MSTLQILRKATDFESFLAGQVVFSEGDPGDVMYVVKDGEVDVLVGGRVIDSVGPGGILGEMALVDRRARSATAVARTDCRLVPISEQRFTFLVQETPFFALTVMRSLADRLRRQLLDKGA